MSISVDKPFRWSDPCSLSMVLREIAAPVRSLRSTFGYGTEYLLEPHMGRGRVEYIDAAPDLWVIAVDWVLQRDLRLQVLDAGLVRFNFGLALDATLRLQGVGEIAANEPAWRVIHNPPDAATLEHYVKETPTRWVTIACRRELIRQLTGLEPAALPALLRAPVSVPAQRESAAHRRHGFCARMRAATADILAVQIDGPTRIPYIRARCTELLCLAMARLIEADSGRSVRARLTERDRELLAKIKARIDADALHCPSSAQLSRQYGINRNKLFYGFKELYGVSVAEYARDLRLVEGRRLLMETDQSIAAIAEQLGFEHPGNFSTAIKRLYGVAPLALRARR